MIKNVLSKHSILKGSSIAKHLASPFPEVFALGGDDRLVLNKETKVNKYFCTPHLRTDVLFRGSCTCNLPTKRGYEAAQNLYDKFSEDTIDIEESMSNTRNRIR